jgi:hypothetical protein
MKTEVKDIVKRKGFEKEAEGFVSTSLKKQEK